MSDASIRTRALTHFEALILRHGEVLHWEVIAGGMQVEDSTVHLASKACGIFRPAHGCIGALTVKTTVARGNRRQWYDDRVVDAEGVFAYRYQGKNPGSHANRSLRVCMDFALPVIYLRGVAPGRYAPYICLVVADEPSELTFTLAPITENDRQASKILSTAALRRDLPLERRYAIRATQQRLHQQAFRELVLDAYSCRCAVCRLRHRNLLDAAHIISDRDVDGQPVLPNGLALCKLHHAAYDGQLIGITPDFEVRIAPAILAETDGPVLEHGLKRLHGSRLQVPRAVADQPDRDRLARRWNILDWRDA
ncbi:MAG: putative restriction endonuclease [Bradymonadia bacterium]|jgi:putative restriction endonuclease